MEKTAQLRDKDLVCAKRAPLILATVFRCFFVRLFVCFCGGHCNFFTGLSPSLSIATYLEVIVQAKMLSSSNAANSAWEKQSTRMKD